MNKVFVLDTNVLLHNADSIKSFEDNTVVIPMAVIEELDHFKSKHDELGRNARAVIRSIDALRSLGSLGKGVPMDNKGTLRIITGKDLKDTVTPLDMNIVDNKIIRVAFNLMEKGEKVIFVSKDINARLKADALGITAVDFEKQKVRFDTLFTGYREIELKSSLIDKFYNNKDKPMELSDVELFPNEFCLLVDDADKKHTALSRATTKNSVEHLGTKFEKAWTIKPRSKEQRMAIELLLDPSIQIVTLVGQAGTGKTLIALAAGMEATLRDNEYDKILVTRPVVPMGNDIGFLPGSKDEKLEHWMQPIFDNLSYLLREAKSEDGGSSVKKEIEKLKKDHLLELEALTYIRGRSIPRQYMIVDEAQNLTPHEVKTIVSRAGEGTKIVLTGDPHQIDSPYLDSSSNGLTYTVERLKNERIHGHITLQKSERSPLAGIAAELL